MRFVTHARRSRVAAATGVVALIVAMSTGQGAAATSTDAARQVAPAGRTAQTTPATPAAPATQKAQPAQKIPALVSQRIAAVGKATAGTRKLDERQRAALSDQLLQVDSTGALDLEVHALGRVGGRERAELARTGARLLSGSDQWVKPQRLKSLPSAGVFRALVPYDRVDEVAALGWVAALRPTESLPPDAGSFLSEGVRCTAPTPPRHWGTTVVESLSASSPMVSATSPRPRRSVTCRPV